MDDEKNNFLNFIQKNYAWIISILSGTGFIFSGVLHFIEYITASVYFMFYGLETGLYKYNDDNFIYSLYLSFIFILALFSLLYCIYQIACNIKQKKYINVKNIFNLILVFISNSYIIFTSKININFISFFISMFLLIIIELIFSYITFKEQKIVDNECLSLKEELLNFFKFLPFAILIIILLHGVQTQITLILKKDYRIINENKVIVYSNNDYFLTLDCKIKNNKLIIYKGTQEKINNENVYSKYIEFDSVSFEN